MFRGPGWVESFVSLKGVGGGHCGFVFSAVSTAREQWLVNEGERQRWPQCRNKQGVYTGCAADLQSSACFSACGHAHLLESYQSSLEFGLAQQQRGCRQPQP